MRRLTPETRRILRRPFGSVSRKVCPAKEFGGRKRILVAVGDFCAAKLIECGAQPDVIVYDHKCMRKPVGPRMRLLLDRYGKNAAVVANPPGFITGMLVDEVRRALKRGEGRIFVEGEEDLAALVALMHASNGTLVAYGQPKKGMVLVEVGPAMRKKARAIFEKMKKG